MEDTYLRYRAWYCLLINQHTYETKNNLKRRRYHSQLNLRLKQRRNVGQAGGVLTIAEYRMLISQRADKEAAREVIKREKKRYEKEVQI